MLQEIRTGTITSKGQIVIPKELRKKGFAEGKKIALLAFDTHIEIRTFDDVSGFLAEKGKIAPLMSERSLKAIWDTPAEEKAWKRLRKGK